MPQVFLSHASEDAAIARQMADVLRAAGVSVWIAPECIGPGEAFSDAIVAGLKASDTLAVLVSTASNTSRHVAREIGLADSFGRRIIPIRIEAVEPSDGLAYYLSMPQWVEWHSQGKAAFAPMIKMLAGAAAAPEPSSIPKSPEASRPKFYGLALIEVRRPWRNEHAAKNVTILRDGKNVGEVANGSSLKLTLPVFAPVEIIWMEARFDSISSNLLSLVLDCGKPSVIQVDVPNLSNMYKLWLSLS